MFSKYENRAKKTARGLILFVTVVICVIVTGRTMVTLFYCPENTQQDVSRSEIQENSTLALISMAVSVWVGLNIYNVLSKEELQSLQKTLQELKEQTQLQLENARTVTERVYTELLKSKFRETSDSTASEFFSTRLERIAALPAEFSEKILGMEDLFQISYQLYGEGISSKDNPKGELYARELNDMADRGFQSARLNEEQYRFLKGYSAWRWGDFLYYQAKYNEFYIKDQKQRKTIAMRVIHQYQEAGRWLFSVENVIDFHNQARANPGIREFLAYLANDIASAYIDFIRDLPDETVQEVIDLERFAVDCSADIPNRVKERFVRNLGCAYERQNQAKCALAQYREAYLVYPGSALSAHCIGSWYRKQALKQFYPALSMQELAGKSMLEIDRIQLIQLSEDKRREVVTQAKKARYWYEVKQSNQFGKAEPRLVELNRFLYNVTGEKEYMQKADAAKECVDFSNEILQ